MRDDSILREINLSAPICDKLKSVYYPNDIWVKCYKEIAIKLSKLKRILQKFYANKSNIEILQEIQKYSAEDIREVMDESEESR